MPESVPALAGAAHGISCGYKGGDSKQRRIGRRSGAGIALRGFGTASRQWVALAHHQADQAETLLLRLLRGSGLKGLGGMRAVRGRYIRPFLSISPAQLEAYEKEQGLTHVEDASNYDIACREIG